jgi:hypothetical protein
VGAEPEVEERKAVAEVAADRPLVVPLEKEVRRSSRPLYRLDPRTVARDLPD